MALPARMLRLKLGGQVDVVDGRGHLWTALLIAGDQLELTSDRAQPLETGVKPCLSWVSHGAGPSRHGRCDAHDQNWAWTGVQPIQADRSVPQAEHRPERWGVILQEAVEQSKGFGCLTCIPVFERTMVDGSASDDLRLIAVTRDAGSPHLETWLAQAAKPAPRIWLAIGPEGGWSDGRWPKRSPPVGLGSRWGHHSAQFNSGSCGVSALCSWRTLSA